MEQTITINRPWLYARHCLCYSLAQLQLRYEDYDVIWPNPHALFYWHETYACVFISVVSHQRDPKKVTVAKGTTGVCVWERLYPSVCVCIRKAVECIACAMRARMFLHANAWGMWCARLSRACLVSLSASGVCVQIASKEMVSASSYINRSARALKLTPDLVLPNIYIYIYIYMYIYTYLHR